MNAKTLKTLRRHIRQALPTAPVRGHTAPRQNVRMVPDYSQLNPDGTLRMAPFFYTGTVTNAPGTQREAYRHAKKVLAQAI